jgi:hypothetical protein
MPPPMIAIEVRRAMFIPHACVCWTNIGGMQSAQGRRDSESRNQLLCCRFLQWVLNGFEGRELYSPGLAIHLSTLRIYTF